MFVDDAGIHAPDTADIDERRRHPRRRVLMAAEIYPIDEEVGFPVRNISHKGVMGLSALRLCVRQRVHVSFNDARYLAAQVCWAEGERYGLELNEPLPFPTGAEPLIESDPDQLRRSPRIPVELAATLLTSLPVLPARIRNLSQRGMLLEIASGLSEGERILVQLRDRTVMAGRIQWARNGFAGVHLDCEFDTPSTGGAV
ncbi:MAG TPA: PilZ domain-containing protein [Sphingobium sp.]|nr:PilZ domain-containing protein [Sphingobium sp.]